MKTLATIVLGFIVLIASMVCLLCTFCAVSGLRARGTINIGIAGAVFALLSLAVAVGSVMLIGQINRDK